MKALVYTGPNSLVFRDEPDPVPEADEVLVRVEAVGICGSDMHAYHGFDARRPPPLILGHEAAGASRRARAGERVTINPLVVDPACPYAIDGRWHLSPTREIISMPPRPGAFAELVRIPLRNLTPIPDTMPITMQRWPSPLRSPGMRCGRECSACTSRWRPAVSWCSAAVRSGWRPHWSRGCSAPATSSSAKPTRSAAPW